MRKISYAAYRFPPEIIQQAIWLYLRFTLGFRDVEDLLGKRGTVVSYQTVRRSVNNSGPAVAADLRKRRLGAVFDLASGRGLSEDRWPVGPSPARRRDVCVEKRAHVPVSAYLAAL
jgi:hypothetical protein